MELNSNEVAALLGIAEPDVREWAYTGKLPIVDAQGRLQFNRQAILEWALAHGHPLNFGVAATEPPGLPALTELFEPPHFHYDVPGHNFAEVLRAALDVFVLPLEDKELVYDLLVSREKLMTTAVGDGSGHSPSPRADSCQCAETSAKHFLHPGANRHGSAGWDARPHAVSVAEPRPQTTSGTTRTFDISVSPSRIRRPAAGTRETGNNPQMHPGRGSEGSKAREKTA